MTALSELVASHYVELVRDLLMDVVAVSILAGIIFFKRHRRRNLVTACVALNVGLLLILMGLSEAATGGAGVGVGFGLFAVLSIIRLRSEETSFTEVGYLFNSLALAVVNGMRLQDGGLMLLLNAAILLTMYVVDHPRWHRAMRRQHVVLDDIYPDEDTLKAVLERRLNGTIEHMAVSHLDYVRDITELDVTYVPTALPRLEKALDEEEAFS